MSPTGGAAKRWVLRVPAGFCGCGDAVSDEEETDLSVGMVVFVFGDDGFESMGCFDNHAGFAHDCRECNGFRRLMAVSYNHVFEFCVAVL